MNLILQSFGNEKEYKRALLVVYSFYAHAKDANSSRIILFTDFPQYFKNHFSDFKVEYVLLTPDRIKKMRGDIDFVHRMKIAIIEEAFQMAQDNIFYADSDTFFIADPTSVINKLTPQLSFMHLYEYKFEALKEMALPAGETFRAFYQFIAHEHFYLTDGAKLEPLQGQVSWNAGAMALHFTIQQYLNDIYLLTNQFYQATKNHASEQYAFSIVLQNKIKLLPCDSVVYHYWYRVKKELMDEWLVSKMDNVWFKLPHKDKTLQVKEWTRTLPTYLENHPVIIKDKCIQAFHRNEFKDGFIYAFQVIVRNQRDPKFIRDILYHTKRMVKLKFEKAT